MRTGMLHDTRAIDSIWLPGKEQVNWTVGQGGVSRIEVYGEPGQRALTPWFAIWIDGEIRVRVNAAAVETVVYVEKE